MPFKREKMAAHNRLCMLPLGSVRAQGRSIDQLLRNKAVVGGHPDELEPEMIATPFVDCFVFPYLPSTVDKEQQKTKYIRMAPFGCTSLRMTCL